MINLPEGYTAVHAKIRFTETYAAKAAISNHVEEFKPGDWIDPVQLDMSAAAEDPTDPNAVWFTEPTIDTGVHAGDWIYIPGSVIEIVRHWPA